MLTLPCKVHEFASCCVQAAVLARCVLCLFEAVSGDAWAGLAVRVAPCGCACMGLRVHTYLLTQTMCVRQAAVQQLLNS